MKWDVVNIVGALVVFLELCFFMGFARYLSKQDKYHLREKVLSNENEYKNKNGRQSEENYPKSPHGIIPSIYHKFIDYITGKEACNYCYEILYHWLELIIKRLKKKCNEKGIEPKK
jgi:hypothetical protein